MFIINKLYLPITIIISMSTISTSANDTKQKSVTIIVIFWFVRDLIYFVLT
jgi:hypothetical protein